MAIGEKTNQDNIKVAFAQRNGQCYLVFFPPLKLRAKGWVTFERGPFPPDRVEQELDKQGLTLQHMICEFLDCSREELDGHSLVQAVEFYRENMQLFPSEASAPPV